MLLSVLILYEIFPTGFSFSLLLSMTNRYNFNSLTNCRVIEKAVIYTDVMAVIKIICVLIL